MKSAFFTLGLFALAAHAAPLTCVQADANGDAVKDSEYNLVLDGQTVKSLNFFGYEVVRDGVVRAENEIGHDVFDVSVSKVVSHNNGLQSFAVALQDYSDVRSWDVTVSPQAGEAVVVGHFESSDGDGLPHLNSVELTCK